MNEKNAIDALQKVKNAFDRHDVEFWLTWGTLLGAIRSNSFIPGDEDIDFATWKKDEGKIKKALNDLENDGFEVHWYGENDLRLFYKDCRVGIDLIQWKNGYYYTTWYKPYNKVGVVLDYLFFIVDLQIPFDSRVNPRFSTVLINMFNVIPSGVRLFVLKYVWMVYRKLFSVHYIVRTPNIEPCNLDTIDFYKMKFRIPRNPVECLELEYGKDWRIPKPYNCWTECLTIEEIKRYAR